MKLFFIFSLLILNAEVYSQNIVTLNYGLTVTISEVEIEFVEVLEDSRCPKNVTCVRAGKAVVLVNVYVDGAFIEERRLEFYPSGFSNESTNTLYNSNGLRISGLNIMPYPIALAKTTKKDYYLELSINYY